MDHLTQTEQSFNIDCPIMSTNSTAQIDFYNNQNNNNTDCDELDCSSQPNQEVTINGDRVVHEANQTTNDPVEYFECISEDLTQDVLIDSITIENKIINHTGTCDIFGASISEMEVSDELPEFARSDHIPDHMIYMENVKKLPESNGTTDFIHIPSNSDEAPMSSINNNNSEVDVSQKLDLPVEIIHPVKDFKEDDNTACESGMTSPQNFEAYQIWKSEGEDTESKQELFSEMSGVSINSFDSDATSLTVESDLTVTLPLALTSTNPSTSTIQIEDDPIPTIDQNEQVISDKKIPELPSMDFEEHEAILKSLNDVYKKGKWVEWVQEYVAEKLEMAFRRTDNPYSLALYFMLGCDDLRSKELETLPIVITGELRKWLLNNESTAINAGTLLHQELKIAAFVILTMQKHVFLIPVICDLFRLKEMNKDFEESIRDMARSGKYHEACVFAFSLALLNFDVHLFIIPLLLQDLEHLTFNYFRGNVVPQIQVIEFFEDILDQEHPIKSLEFYIQSNNILKVKKEDINLKRLKKMTTRLEKMFSTPSFKPPVKPKLKKSTTEVPQKEIPNDFIKFPKEEEIQRNVTWKYKPCRPRVVPEKSILAFLLGPEVPDSLRTLLADKTLGKVKTTMGVLTNSQQLIISDDDLCRMISCGNCENNMTSQPGPSTSSGVTKRLSRKEAVASALGISLVRESSKKCCSIPKKTPIVSNFYTIPLESREISYFDNTDGVEVFVKHLRAMMCIQQKRGGPGANLLVVSLDAKWISSDTGERVSLILVGLADEIFIIDTLRMKTYKKWQATIPWVVLLTEFFANESILKVGYNTERIVRLLSITSKYWSNLKDQFKMLLDLGKVGKEILKQSENFFPYSEGNSVIGYGLSELVRISVGKPLSQTELKSNWEERPLRDSQINSAATITFALIDVFNSMMKQAGVLNFDFENLISNMLLVNVVQPKPGPSKKQRGVVQLTRKFSLPGNPFRTPQTAGDVKVLCDHMFRDLGKQLRVCGIDTLIISATHSASTSISIAQRDNRTIITTHAKAKECEYDKVILAEKCLKITSITLKDQIKRVLKHLNLTIREVDLFTKCQFCNSDSFIHVRTETLKNLIKLDQRVKKVVTENDIEHYEIPWITCYTEVELGWKTWNILPETSLSAKDKKNIRTRAGVPIFFDTITPAHLEKVGSYFLICNTCGKMYCAGLPGNTSSVISDEPDYSH